MKCRFEVVEILPNVDKKVIYLDQFALSEICKIDMGIRRAEASRRDFWESAHAALKQGVLLQQAICPGSDVHLDETIVFKGGDELRRAYRGLSGDASFLDSEQVALKQLSHFITAFSNGEDSPPLEFNVDEILHGSRNSWLPDISVFVNADYSSFADDIRSNRDRGSKAFNEVAERWAREKKNFEEVLQEELESIGTANKQALVQALQLSIQGLHQGDIKDLINGALAPAYIQFLQAKERFQEMGLSAEEAGARVFEFWSWPELQRLPVHRISAYLFAALARKMAAGQKRAPSQGMLNDIKAISTYAPYVDAMFLDNECAALLAEEPLRSELQFKANIFSLNSADDFLDYLAHLEKGASAEVRAYAAEIYGLAV